MLVIAEPMKQYPAYGGHMQDHCLNCLSLNVIRILQESVSFVLLKLRGDNSISARWKAVHDAIFHLLRLVRQLAFFVEKQPRENMMKRTGSKASGIFQFSALITTG